MTTITFDIYGTLVQWTETVDCAFGAVLPRASQADVQRACQVFEARTRHLQAEGAFRPFVEILKQSASLAIEASGRSATDKDVASVLDLLANVPPHPDAPLALEELAMRHRLVPISNSDDDFLKGTLAGLGDVFSDVVTAEQARAYKPNPELFRFAQKKLSITGAEQLHVAQGMFADIAVCSALNIKAVWINRTGATIQQGLTPLATRSDLNDFASFVDRLMSA